MIKLLTDNNNNNNMIGRENVKHPLPIFKYYLISNVHNFLSTTSNSTLFLCWTLNLIIYLMIYYVQLMQPPPRVGIYRCFLIYPF